MKFSYVLLMHRALFLTLGLCVLPLLFGVSVPSARAQSPSYVRVLHASPFVGTADVFVDGTKLLSSFAFASVTGYVPIPPGSHKVQIALVGKGIGGAALSQTLAVSPGVAYTVAAIGATATTLSLEVFIDNNLLTPNTAKVRVYQLSPDLGSVSVAAGGKILLNSIAYQQASGYFALSAGGYTFTVQAPAVNATLPITATLPANTVTSIFAVGMFNGTPKIELVSAQTNGLPGLPDTGSDPNPARTQASTSLSLWMIIVVLIAATVITRRLVRLRAL